MAGKCLWCGGVRDDLLTLEHRREYEGVVVPTHAPLLACPDHEEQVDAYMREVARRSGAVMIIMIAVMATITIGALTGRPVVTSAGVVLCGAWAFAFPYATPETVRRLGAEASMTLVRWLGAVIFVAGAVWCGFTLA